MKRISIKILKDAGCVCELQAIGLALILVINNSFSRCRCNSAALEITNFVYEKNTDNPTFGFFKLSQCFKKRSNALYMLQCSTG